MRSIKTMSFAALLVFGVLSSEPLTAQQPNSGGQDESQEESSTKGLKDRSQRGTLHDAFQKVRGDSGKWNDDPQLQHAPSIKSMPAKMSLDDWADALQQSKLRSQTSNDDNWLLFKTRQLDDNDRVWIDRIERHGNQFTIVLNEAIWQGRYFKSFTYYDVFGVNLGKLAPGEYLVKWMVEPSVFREFAGSGRPTGEQGMENWPKDDRPAENPASKLSVSFTVATAPN